MLKKLTVFFVVLVMLTMTFSTAYAGRKNSVQQDKVRHEIAVVFDNSGSMFADLETMQKDPGNPKNVIYTGYNDAWCYAKYAMEIFASMLNFEQGDELFVFPMHKVQIGQDKKLEDRIDIKSDSDIRKLSEMKTVNPSSTPFKTVEKAEKFLKGLKSDESTKKWLIILTDGAFDEFFDENKNYHSNDFKEELASKASDEIRVQYLGIGKEAEEVSSAGNLYARNIKDAEKLQEALIDICNQIFERNKYDLGKGENSLSFDVSMSKILVFQQGKGSEEIRLRDGSGQIKNPDKGIDIRSSTIDDSIFIVVDDSRNLFDHGYKTINENHEPSLAAHVISFSDCGAGNYELVTDADLGALQIYYEPDVTLMTTVKDSEGNALTDPDQLVEGVYTVESKIIDNKTGEDVSSSSLLGGNVKYDIKYGGKEITNGGTIEIKSGDTIDYESKVKLLNYTIYDESSVLAQVAGKRIDSFDVDVATEQNSNWFRSTAVNGWKPIVVTFRHNNGPLTDKDLKGFAPVFAFSNEDIKYTVEDAGAGQYRIWLGKTDDGFAKPADGEYKFSASGKLEQLEANGSIDVHVHWWSVVIVWLIILLIILLLVLLVIFIMSRKVLPNRISATSIDYTFAGNNIQHGNDFDYNKKGRQLTITSAMPPQMKSRCEATFDLRPLGKRWTASKNRQFEIVGISNTSMGVSSVIINGTEYIKDGNDQWVNSLNPNRSICQRVKRPTIIINAQRASLTCTTSQR